MPWKSVILLLWCPMGIMGQELCVPVPKLSYMAGLQLLGGVTCARRNIVVDHGDEA